MIILKILAVIALIFFSIALYGANNEGRDGDVVVLGLCVLLLGAFIFS